jgi:hypothetical protein
MHKTHPVRLEAEVGQVPNKYLVKIQTTGTCCAGKHLTSLTTSVFDELDLKDEKVDLKTPSEGTETHWFVTTVPKGSSLYQGALYDFDKNKSPIEMADDYYQNYYDKRNQGVYFVGPKHVADMYGDKIDRSRIIYATMPDLEGEKQLTNPQEYLYALCYIPGLKGSRVKYTTTTKLKLLDISKIENVRFIWSITETLKEEEKKNEQYVLTETLVKEVDDNVGHSITVRRKSSDSYDPDLILFFKNYLIPYVKNNYGIELHGWIYHQMEGNSFHDEICLMDRSHLHFDSVKISEKTKYKSLPTMEEWKKQQEAYKVPNNRQCMQHSTLTSLVNRPFIGPRRKEDGKKTPQVWEDTFEDE